MRYSPYEVEYAAAPEMTDAQRLEYFMSRIFETEEVWSLDDGVEWVFHDDDGVSVLPLWPYRKFAQDCCTASWQVFSPAEESLESFMEQLSMLSEEGVMLEVMRMPAKRGCLIEPETLQSILQGMIDAGEYTLDG